MISVIISLETKKIQSSPCGIFRLVREDADRYVREAYSWGVCPTPESPIEFILKSDLAFGCHLA